jgi:hypothetical protein
VNKFANFIVRESREIIPPFLFFMVVFHMLAITKAVLQSGHDVTILRSVVATIMALTVAKSILLVDAFRFARIFELRPLAYSIAWKTLLFGVVTLVFRYIEELISQLSKQESLGAACRQVIEGVNGAHFWTMQMWLWAAVLLYTSVAELVNRYGREAVRNVMFRREV